MDSFADNKNKEGYRWQLPTSPSDLNKTVDCVEKHQLKILNSFTKRKELFISKEKKTIKWYSCGPTVYDISHLGHARCYITFDIIRRILTNYFGYHVFYVMNITDIDDKIIKRARSNYLCDRFIDNYSDKNTFNKEELLSKLKEYLINYEKRRVNENDPDKLIMINNILSKGQISIKKFEELFVTSSGDNLKDVLEELRDIIADEEDFKYAHTVTDHEIFKLLTMKYEQEYHDDMQKLNVLPPNALTRVSEYIEEVGLYLKKLESNGFAYRTPDGSVYFDTEKFDNDSKHFYAKLVREAYGHKKSLDEGEGELSCMQQQDIKKSPNDFALWKKSKIGEPSWQTQDYESGRPGWHIECSVMASDLLGENFDIHSGGNDLKFPHHDNEIAQAEAYYNTGNNWVNYFIHSGHLTISGCKMSKSLKNFITIKQALEEYTSRQLRFAFLSHTWAETLDYSPNTMSTAMGYEKTFREFFLNVSDTLRRKQNKLLSTTNNDNKFLLCNQFRKWSQEDKQLNQEFMATSIKVDVALCDNFDTRTVLNALSGLVKECNKRPETDLKLLKDIASFVFNILNIFGATFNEEVSFNDHQQKSPNSSSNESNLKYVETLAQFRADIRRITKSGDAQQCIKQILTLCDTLRDQTLPNLGVRLEDKEIDGASFVVKFVDPEVLARERAIAEKNESDKRIKEEAVKLAKLKLQQEREEKMKIPPSEMFRNQTDKYSQFDERGMPTHDVEGKEITKSALKKLQKLYAEQEIKFNKYKLSQS